MLTSIQSFPQFAVVVQVENLGNIQNMRHQDSLLKPRKTMGVERRQMPPPPFNGIRLIFLW